MSRYYDTLNLADSLRINNTTVVDSGRNLINIARLDLSSGNAIRSNSEIDFLTLSNQAQTVQMGGLGIGSSYSGYPAFTGGVNTQNGYKVGGTTVIDSNKNGLFQGLTAGGGSNTVRLFTNTADSRVLKLRDRSNDTGNIIQFEEYNGANTWELVGRKGGTYPFYIYKNWGTNSGYKLTIDQNGHGKWYSGDFDVRTGNLRVGNTTNSINGYQVNGTTVIDSSRNATFASQLIVRGAGNSSKGNIHMGDAGNGTNKWSYLTGAHYNADTESKGFGLIGGLSLASENRAIIGGGVYETNPCTSIEFWGHTATTHATGGTQRAVIDSGGFNLKVGNYEVNGTTVIDSSRNLTNIGTVSTSSTITCGGEVNASGDIYAGGGQVYVNSGNADVKLGLWGNNGTTYGIGMTSGVTYGGLNDYAMTFCMNNESDRGFWWGYSGQSKASGAMSLTTAGVLTVASNISTGGSITASGNVTAYSDERLKDNVETLDGSKVYQMRGVSFTKDGEAGSGVIAQELELVAPELVMTNQDEMQTKSVAYGNVVGYLIEAIKELKQEIEELKNVNSN